VTASGATPWRLPGAILLLSCYELGRQPLGTAWPAAFLERAGFRPDQIDLAVDPLDPVRVRRARAVVLSVPMHTALRIGVAAARRVQALNPAAHVVFSGLYAVLNAAYLRSIGAAAVLAGEQEAALVTLMERLERTDAAEQADPAGILARLDYPVPSRSALPSPTRYAALEVAGQRVLAGAVEASRGCLHRCRHCPVPAVYGGRFFVVPAAVVLADVQQQVDRGARHITFGDPDFLNGPRHALRVARALHARFPDVTFDFTAKVAHLIRHRALLGEMRELGCLFVVTAVESLSDRVLTVLDKGHDATDVRTALGLLRAAGIAPRPTFVPFTPWTNLADHLALFDFIADEELVDHVDPVQYTLRLLVPPGSLLLEHPALAPHLGPPRPEHFTVPWTHPDPRMDRLQASALELVRGLPPDAPAAESFLRLWAQARAAAALPAPPRPTWTVTHPRPPRLTEPWFC